MRRRDFGAGDAIAEVPDVIKGCDTGSFVGKGENKL
jgi:hypothetical protein